MTISMLLIILTLASGPRTQSFEPTSPPAQSSRPPMTIRGECYINGVWYNPCTETYPPRPEPHGPEIQQ